MTFKTSSLRRLGIAALLSVGLSHAPRLFAQANITGSLHGTITDPTGAGLPNSTATLTNLDTAVTYKGTVDSRGQYLFPSVPPGKYSLVVDAPGFSETKFDNVVIDLNQAEVLPVKLAVGGAGTTVDVSTESESIVTTQTSVTGLFTAKEIVNLPLNGRDYQNLIYLSPGVTRAAGGEGQGSGVVAAGTRATNNNYLIDGADNNDPVVPSGAAGGASGEIGPVPLDEVAEFTIIATNGSAEFGRSSGAVINVVTKSGTNSIHGTLFEFVRNPKFNTRQWFDPVGFKSAFKQNDFGGRFGIPIIKDKFFMAGAYEGYRQRAGGTTTEFFPSIELENTITDPLFKAYLQGFFPQVSNGGTAITSANYTQSGVGSLSAPRKYTNNLDGDTGFVRFDYVWSERHQSFVTGSILDGNYGGANSATVAYSGYGETLRPYHFVLGDNFAFTPHILNTFRLAVQRTSYEFPGEHIPGTILSAGSLRTAGPFAGIPFLDNTGSANGVPTVASTVGLFNTASTPSNFPQGRSTNVSALSDAVTIEKGKHEIKFGGELTYIQENGVFSNAIRPTLSILDTSLAGFDAGTINSQSQYFYLNPQGTSNRGFRQLEQGYFVEDSWRASERLTLEAGIRYDLYPAFGEIHHYIGNAFLLDANNNPEWCTSLPVGSAAMSNVVLLNPANYGHKAICNDYNNFAPRIGFSYDVTGKGKTVFRGGYGYYYDRIFDNVFGNSRFNAPAVAPTSFSTSSCPAALATPGAPCVFDGSQAVGAINATQVYTGTILDPHLRTPYTQHFNLTFSQELDKATSFTAAYVGSIGTKLFATENPNYGTSFPDQFRPSNAPYVTTGGAFTPRSASDLAAGIVRPPFGNLSYRTSNASSSFHSLELTLKRRTSHGFSGQVAYTFAHSMDNVSDEIAGGTDSASPQSTVDNLLAPYLAPGSPCTTAQVPAASLTAATVTSATTYQGAVQCASGNPNLVLGGTGAASATNYFVANYSKFRPIGANYGDSGFDVRQRIATNVVYALPFGRGKMIGHDVNGFVNEFIGGWNLSSTIDFQTGTPFVIFSGADANRDGTNNDHAKLLTPGSPISAQLVKNSPLFNYPAAGANISRFQCPVTAPFGPNLTKTCADGNSNVIFGEAIGTIDPTTLLHRGYFREPGIFNWDAELAKNFHVYKEANLRFSADGFNVLNRANFSTLGSTLTSGTFSRASATRAINNTVSRQFQFALKLEF
jgi:hypothetical protein